MKQVEDRNSNKDKNKNSFRDMILIIFVVLICFGITIYGIAYLTGKVFSSDDNLSLVAQNNEKDVTTNPKEGETITFTSIDEEADEVEPKKEEVEANKSENDELAAAFESNFSNDDKNNEVALNNRANKKTIESPKKVEEKIEPKKETPKREEAPKVEPKKEVVKKEEPKKETITQNKEVTNPKFAVQVSALDSKAAAEKEIQKLKKHFPDAYYIQVTVNGKTVYRIRIGKSETRAEAEKYLNKYKAQYRKEGFVTAIK